jgi:hypothetical protein
MAQPSRSGDATSAPVTNRDSLASLLDWWLPTQDIFSQMPLHGNTHWVPLSLACLALVWAWSSERNVTDAFHEAKKDCKRLGHDQVPQTYQGFMGALVRWKDELVTLLCGRLRQCMEDIGGRFWRLHGWVVLAVDGSRSTAPRTRANEKAFCAPNYGHGQKAQSNRRKKAKTNKKKKARRKKAKNNASPMTEKKLVAQPPQMWITLLWHVGLRLPWAWRLGPSNSSERAHAMEMIRDEDFPKKTLFCGDAGFIGYDFWKSILDRRCQFLVRVGGNVHLLARHCDYQRRSDARVLCWPKDQRDKGNPPLELRRIKVRLAKKKKMFLLTSVLCPERLSGKDAASLYQKRWGVEVEFRGLKQTLDRSKLCCRREDRAYVEMDWSLLGMAVAELLALKEQFSDPKTPCEERDPLRRSLAETMRALRQCLRELGETPALEEDLRSRLARAKVDTYQRKSSKKARYRPPNPDKKPLGEPDVKPLTPQLRKKLQQGEQKAA